MQCPYCGGDVSANAKACGHCGRWLDQKPAAQRPPGPDSRQDRTAALDDATLAAYERPPAPPAPPAAAPALSVEWATSAFAWLVVVDAPDRREIGRAVALQPGTTAIGRSRSKGNHLVLNDESCSSVHARIDVEPRPGQEPAFVLYDAGSKNGVRVANVASQAGQGSRVQRHELRDGDRILMGETALVFKRI